MAIPGAVDIGCWSWLYHIKIPTFAKRGMDLVILDQTKIKVSADIPTNVYIIHMQNCKDTHYMYMMVGVYVYIYICIYECIYS